MRFIHRPSLAVLAVALACQDSAPAAAPATQQAFLKPAAVGTSQAVDLFGASVAIWGDTLVVGAFNEDSGTTGVNTIPNESSQDSGAVYVYVRSGSNWIQQAYLKPTGIGMTNASDYFGTGLAICGDTLVVGAHFEDSSSTGVNGTPDEAAQNSGAAYVFVRHGTTWTQQAYLKPAAVGASQQDDLFGGSVGIFGDTIVVGAPSEDSKTTGVNSVPDDSGTNCGAAYVFTRSGTNWNQQAYLKPAAVGTTQALDIFGGDVSVFGNTIVVGAIGESSSSTGVNSIPNEGAPFAGAAYLFQRSGTLWTQKAYLKPAAVGSTQADDYFGTHVAVHGHTVVIGAPFEDSSTTGVNGPPNELAPLSGAAYVFTTPQGPPITQITGVSPFQFRFVGDGSPSYQVQASTNLIDWVSIGSASNLGGSVFEFRDPAVGLIQSRFYRLQLP